MVASARLRIAVGCLVFAQVVLVGATMVGARHGAPGERAPLARLQTGVPAGTPLTIEGGFAGAQERARQWAPDAVLFAAGMQVDWPTDPTAAKTSEIPGTGWVLYTFASEKRAFGPKGRAATLSMLVDRRSGLVIDEREMGWTWPPRREVAITTYPISSVVALFAADATDGNGYRVACPQFHHLSRVSIVPSFGGEDPSWLVTYEDQRAAGTADVHVKVDAISGRVERQDRGTTAPGGC